MVSCAACGCHINGRKRGFGLWVLEGTPDVQANYCSVACLKKAIKNKDIEEPDAGDQGDVYASDNDSPSDEEGDDDEEEEAEEEAKQDERTKSEVERGRELRRAIMSSGGAGAGDDLAKRAAAARAEYRRTKASAMPPKTRRAAKAKAEAAPKEKQEKKEEGKEEKKPEELECRVCGKPESEVQLCSTGDVCVRCYFNGKEKCSGCGEACKIHARDLCKTCYDTLAEKKPIELLKRIAGELESGYRVPERTLVLMKRALKALEKAEQPLALLGRAKETLESDLQRHLDNFILPHHKQQWRLADGGKRLDVFSQGNIDNSYDDGLGEELGEEEDDHKLDITEGKTVVAVELPGDDVRPRRHIILSKKLRLPDEEEESSGDEEDGTPIEAELEKATKEKEAARTNLAEECGVKYETPKPEESGKGKALKRFPGRPEKPQPSDEGGGGGGGAGAGGNGGAKRVKSALAVAGRAKAFAYWP